jgi:hypothetical protein
VFETAEIPGERPVIAFRRDDFNDGLETGRADRRKTLGSFHQVENVWNGLGIDVRISLISRVDVIGTPGLSGELGGEDKENSGERVFQGPRAEKFHKRGSTDPGEENHPMIKAEEAPGRFVRDDGIDGGEDDGIERKESEERRSLAGEGEHCADDSKNKN